MCIQKIVADTCGKVDNLVEQNGNAIVVHKDLYNYWIKQVRTNTPQLAEFALKSTPFVRIY